MFSLTRVGGIKDLDRKEGNVQEARDEEDTCMEGGYVGLQLIREVF
jgi:hypothetical protein